MMANISVSVVIPVYNGADTIAATLTALLHQIDPPHERQIIVVDNNSIDKTGEVVRQFPVTLLSEPKRGPSAARNQGLQAARGEVVVYIDADTLPTRQWLREILLPFEDPRVMLVGGETFSFPPTTPAQRYRAWIGLPRFEYQMFRASFPFVASRNLAVRRAAAIAIGGWDEDMLTGEDVDFSFRLTRFFSTQYVIQSSAVLFHRDRESIEAMCQQARSYGTGWAKLYEKYPDVARWNFGNSIQLAGILLIRLISRAIWHSRTIIGLAPAERVEYADCHWWWSWAFWRGFFYYRRHHRIN